MRIICFLSLFCFPVAVCFAQNYQITFAGTGTSSTVDSVKVENLTQCTTISIGGSDILNLAVSAGIYEEEEGAGSVLQVYPNPMSDYCLVDFGLKHSGITTLELYDLAGNKMMQVSKLLLEGDQTIRISGIGKGIYTLKIESESSCGVAKIVSMESLAINPQIEFLGTETGLRLVSKANNNEKSLTYMQYNTGDLLKLTGKSGIYRTVFMLTPVNSQTVTFVFMACTDTDGNNYSVVKIGDQWWMAENLNVGTYVPVTHPQVSGTKFCQNYNGQNDPTCPMGGLYEFANVMQGASPCNGSGAPPDDKCSTPVQGLCPDGWHLPSHYEWTTLERNAGLNPSDFPYNTTTISILGTDEGGNLKETCTNHWWDPNAGATNKTGFTALPGGSSWQGVFDDYGQSGYWWSSTEQVFMYAAWVRGLNYSLPTVGRSGYFEESGFNVRCVKD